MLGSSTRLLCACALILFAAAWLPACGDDDDDAGGSGSQDDFGDDDDDVTPDPDDAYETIKKCETDSSSYSFTLSKVPICGVEIQDDKSLSRQSLSTDSPTVDVEIYASWMDALLGEVKGYAWVLVSTRDDLDPGIVAEGAGGTAWQKSNAAGGVDAIGFNTDTLANVGSVTKVVSGVSFLHMFESLPTDLNPDGINLETFLKIPFIYFLPERARKKVDKSLAVVTIGHLLRHKSGLINNTAPDSRDDFKNLAKWGADTDKLGTRKYNNMNSVILRYLVPFIDSPSTRNAVNDKFSVFTTLQTMSEVIDHDTRVDFTDYINDVITPIVGGDFRLSCTPALEPDSEVAMMFGTLGSDQGYLSDATSLGGCSSQGGNWFSARGFGDFLLAFGQGDLVSEHTRLSMSDWYVPGDNLDEWGTNRLIWSRFGTAGDGTFSQYFNDNFGGAYWFGHGGDHPKTVDGVKYEAHAGLIEFPWGYYGFVVVNSGEKGSSALMLQEQAGFDAALGKS